MLTMAKLVRSTNAITVAGLQPSRILRFHACFLIPINSQGGMDGMNVFYKHCLESLYPPGSCGKYCNGHTFTCYEKEVHSACCDEGGLNCKKHIPKTCPVGCGARLVILHLGHTDSLLTLRLRSHVALVFPEFMETCRDHVHKSFPQEAKQFESFEKGCLEQDSLALVEYAIDLKKQGCTIDLTGQRRRLQNKNQIFLQKMLSSKSRTCSWNEITAYGAHYSQFSNQSHTFTVTRPRRV